MCTRNCRQTVTYCMVHCEFLIIKRALWKFTKYFQVLWLRSVKSNGHILFLVLPCSLSVCSFLCDLPSIMSRVTLSEAQGHLSCRGASGLSLGWAFSLHKQLCAPGWLRPHLPSLSPQGWVALPEWSLGRGFGKIAGGVPQLHLGGHHICQKYHVLYFPVDRSKLLRMLLVGFLQTNLQLSVQTQFMNPATEQ